MNKIRVAINGFGRIGRISLRYLLEKENIEVVAANDLAPPETLVHLLKYDSVHGAFPYTCTLENGKIKVKNQSIALFAEKEPEKLPWGDLQVDVVLECTGAFRSAEAMGRHLKGGAKKVLLSAPGDKDVPMFVMGINEKDIRADQHLISNASCTTNCLAPMVKVLHDAFGVESGFMTTIHAYTSDQNLLDAPHRDLRRARSAALSMIPTTTGAAKALGKIIPDLAGKVDGYAVRVPTPNGSFTDFTANLKREVTSAEINAVMKEAAEGSLKNILEYQTDPLVSTDIIGNPHSCIFDSLLTNTNGKMIKIGGWYDNEGGYSARLADMVVLLGTLQ